jgi:hypothetical protein
VLGSHWHTWEALYAQTHRHLPFVCLTALQQLQNVLTALQEADHSHEFGGQFLVEARHNQRSWPTCAANTPLHNAQLLALHACLSHALVTKEIKAKQHSEYIVPELSNSALGDVTAVFPNPSLKEEGSLLFRCRSFCRFCQLRYLEMGTVLLAPFSMYLAL